MRKIRNINVSGDCTHGYAGPVGDGRGSSRKTPDNFSGASPPNKKTFFTLLTNFILKGKGVALALVLATATATTACKEPVDNGPSTGVTETEEQRINREKREWMDIQLAAYRQNTILGINSPHMNKDNDSLKTWILGNRFVFYDGVRDRHPRGHSYTPQELADFDARLLAVGHELIQIHIYDANRQNPQPGQSQSQSFDLIDEM